MVTLTTEHRVMAVYRRQPSRWVTDHIDIELARCRSRTDLEGWLRQQDPESHQWCRSNLDRLQLDPQRSYQADALDRMARPGWYAFQWANGTAKTTTAALAVLWFLDCYADSRVLTTAGTWSQLQEQLWREIPMWAERAKQPIVAQGRIGRTQINVKAGWAAFGRGADKADTFEGVHAPHVMVVVDEAKAVKAEIFDAIRRILRGNQDASCWFICLSSPGSPTGPFYSICLGSEAKRWNHLQLSAYESERVALEQIAADAEDLGESSPLFIAMDLGQFPDEGEDTIIPLSWAQAAVGRTVSTEGGKFLGIDPARFGSDQTVLVTLTGRTADITATYQGKDTTWTANRALEILSQDGYRGVGVDDTGIGGAVTDQLRAALSHGRRWQIVPINFGGTDGLRKPERFVNLKAEIYFQLRDEFEAGYKDQYNPHVGLSIPNDRELLHQLTSQRYSYDNRNRYRLEGHGEMKRRGEKSPDKADALAIANRLRGGIGSHNGKALELNAVAAYRGSGATLRSADF